MKKHSYLLSFLSVIFCGLTTQVTADSCTQPNPCCEWSDCTPKMSLGADWLYWKIQQDGITPGSIVTTDDTAVPTLGAASAVRPHFKSDSGFRVNLGYEIPGEPWVANITYTYLPSHAKTTPFAALSTAETFNPADGSTAFNTFESKWNLSSNNIDFDIGNTIDFKGCLSLRPHIGFRAVWFDQKFRSFGTALDTTTLTTSFTENVIKEKFQGYGVEGGLWMNYQLLGEYSSGLSLVGHIGGSILYSKFSVRSTRESGDFTFADPLTVSLLNVSSSSFYTATPTLDYLVGLQHSCNFCATQVDLHIGWEQHILFDTNRFLSSGNLSAQGLTLRLELGF